MTAKEGHPPIVPLPPGFCLGCSPCLLPLLPAWGSLAADDESRFQLHPLGRRAIDHLSVAIGREWTARDGRSGPFSRGRCRI